MELSNQFTKEQLIERINETLSCFRHFITPDDEWQTIKKTIAIYEIALAALTAAPIGAFHISDQQVGATTDYIKDGEWPIDNGVIEVYAVQPAPAVPEERPSLNNGIIGFDEGWNAFRAAMLKGGAK